MKRKFLFILLLFKIIFSVFAEKAMVFVEGGEMILGDKDYKWNQPHKVLISSFYMSKYLVTMGDFKEFLKDTNLSFDWDGRITEEYLTVKEAVPNDNCPAQGMTWLYAVLFCNWLSEKEELEPCYEFSNDLNDQNLYENMVWNHKANGYRLPTAAEWEYAARGGKLSKGYKYPGSNDLSEVNKVCAVSYEIGEMKPNELEIHDMGGLVSEYCYDWYNDKMWEWLPQTDPCFEKLSSIKDSLQKQNNREFQLCKLYKGADRGDYYNASSYNIFALLLSNSSTIGIRLVRSETGEQKSQNRKTSKTTYNELEEKKTKILDVTINSDGTIKIDGKVVSKNGSLENGENKIRIGQNNVFLNDSKDTENGKINDSRVRLRSAPNLSCDTLSFFEKNEVVLIISHTVDKFSIDGEKWYWYQVKTNDGTTGWVYGKYLDIEK